MRLALCQMNLRVGDLDANAASIEEWSRAAADAGADLAVFPEQSICGYPADDLLLKRHFLDACQQTLEQLTPRLALPSLVGWPELAEDVFNSCALIAGGRHVATYRKQHLPNYGVFDEHRYFRKGSEPAIARVGDAVVGITVCEDIWLATGPGADEASAGAHVIVNLSASPYRLGRGVARERMLATRAADALAFVALCNQVGGQDELVFDGHSIVVDHTGEIVARAAQFEEELLVCDIDVDRVIAARLHDTRHRSGTPREHGVRMLADVGRKHRAPAPRQVSIAARLSEEGEAYTALRTGLHDYVAKNCFPSVTLGLSGGIDSALVLALAVDAFGPERVHPVTMPSRYSSEGTRGDAHVMADRLGVMLLELPIEPVFEAFSATLADAFAGASADVTEENLQARIRGTLLMALSNKHGHLVLTTGNKSETSVGYATLYGDMAGGFAPIKDVPKTLVYRLARWRNERARAAGEPEPIPASIIDRPPTAELRENQRDEDSLPPYDLLDELLERLVELDASPEQLVAQGFDPAVVARVAQLVDRAEHKRRQAPPGVRITGRAFGRDRRMPITNGFVAGRSLAPTPPDAASTREQVEEHPPQPAQASSQR